MKRIKVVKLQRVRYGDLDEGDRYHAEWAQTANKGSDKQKGMHYIPKDEKVKALNLDKYPPEVTYTIEGMTEDEIRYSISFGRESVILSVPFNESEIETRYE